MSDYVRVYNLTVKDSLPTGNSNKVIKGTELDTELNAVAAAIASKTDSNSPDFTGVPKAPTATYGTNTTQLATTAFVQAAVSPITYETISQAEVETGTSTTVRNFTAQRIAQAIAAQVPSSFPSGTLMLFQQTTAPTGWTKQTTHNDKVLRVVSGTASSGGTSAFTTVFTNQTPTITTSGLSASATTLSTSQIPSHRHFLSGQPSFGSGYQWYIPIDNSAGMGAAEYNSGYNGPTQVWSQYEGGGGSHTHGISGSASSSAITLNVQYVDLIIASKN